MRVRAERILRERASLANKFEGILEKLYRQALLGKLTRKQLIQQIQEAVGVDTIHEWKEMQDEDEEG